MKLSRSSYDLNYCSPRQTHLRSPRTVAEHGKYLSGTTGENALGSQLLGEALYLVAVIVRFFWSLTIGIPFFALGLALFLLLDILAPKSDRGYRCLNSLYKIGSLGVFKGVRMEGDSFDIHVEKKRRP